MKSRESVIRQKQFQCDEKRRQAGQIEAMIEEFTRMIAELDNEIAAEHRRTGIDDEKHFAYSTFAKSAKQRRANLQASVNDLQQQHDTARAALEQAVAELAQEEERLERETAHETGRPLGGRAAG